MAQNKEILSDGFLIKRAIALQDAIRRWAEKNFIWQDCGFSSWIDHYDSPPDPGIPAAFLLCLDGNFAALFGGSDPRNLLSGFEEIVTSAGFWWDMMDSTTIVFMASDEEVSKAYGEIAEWNWTSSLVAPDFALIHESIFEYFRQIGRESLLKLSPRNFEVYLDSLFQGCGYRTVLGSGTNDGGVDLRLYSSEITGEVLTLVQAKRYALKRPIRLDAVQALTAAVDYEPAQKGLFVTTSRFLPSARRFAERKAAHVKLLAGQEILELSEMAAKDIAQRRADLISYDRLTKLMAAKVEGKLDGQIFHARTGCGINTNKFALCVKSSAGAALLSPIPLNVLSHDGSGQTGYHVPDLSISALNGFKRSDMFMAKISASKLKTSSYLWGNRELYSIWDGKPCFFNLCD